MLLVPPSLAQPSCAHCGNGGHRSHRSHPCKQISCHACVLCAATVSFAAPWQLLPWHQVLLMLQKPASQHTTVIQRSSCRKYSQFSSCPAAGQRHGHWLHGMRLQSFCAAVLRNSLYCSSVPQIGGYSE